MFLLLVLSSLTTTESSKLVEYRLWKNFGEIIFDFSLNNRHGVNGHSQSSTSFNVLFSDRGAYFPVNSMIDLLPNEYSSNDFNYPLPCTLIFWVNSQEDNGRFFMKWKSGYYFQVNRDMSNKRACIIIQQNSVSNLFCTLPGTWISSTWILLNVKLNRYEVQLNINSDQINSFGLNEEYFDNGTFSSHFIGTDQGGAPSLPCFLWYFVVLDEYSGAINPYYAGSSSACFRGNCTCNRSINVPELGIVCVSTSTNISQDSLGFPCDIGKTCWKSVTFTCACYDSSCLYEENTGCGCIDLSLKSISTNPCSCFINGQDCCNPLCSSCSTSTNCSKCKISNSSPSSSTFCSCDKGFYSPSPLTRTSICIPCLPDCLECSNSYTCQSCKNPNSELNPTTGLCQCILSYFNSSLNSSLICSKCMPICKHCTNSSTCTICLDPNSYPSGSLCPCANSYYLSGTGCSKCQNRCLECTSEKNCTSCKDLKASINSSGNCECQEFYFESLDNQGLSCFPCLEECASCKNSLSCSSCKDLNSFLNSSSRCQCKDGFYKINDNSFGFCLKCLEECGTCADGNTCKTCKFSNISVDEYGKCKCNDGFYRPYPLENSNCTKCNSLCKTCENHSKCLTCFDEYSEVDDDFICKCKAGFFREESDTGAICKKCSDGCGECLNDTSCERCVDSYAYLNENKSCACPDGFWNSPVLVDNRTCLECNKSCNTCSSYNYCLQCSGDFQVTDENGFCQCLETFTLVLGQCSCPLGFTLSNNSCVDFYFNFTIKVNNENKLRVIFSQTPLDISKNDISLSINSLRFSYKISKTAKKVFLITLNLQDSIKSSTKATIKIEKKILFSDEGAKLSNYSFSVDLNKQEILNANLKALVSKAKASSQAIATTSLSISIVSNPAAAWALVNTMQFIRYIPLTEEPLSPTITKFCLAIGQYNLLPNVMSLILNSNSSDVPFKEAVNNGIEVSVFWINIGNIIISLVALIVLVPVLIFFSYLNVGMVSLKCKKILSKYKFGVFIRFWIQVYLDFFIFAVVQIRSEYRVYLGEYLFNIISAVAVLTLIVVTIPVIIFLNCFYYEKISQNDQEFLSKYGSLYGELKNNRGKLGSSYYTIYFIRRLAYVLSQIYLNSLPFLQKSLNLFLAVSNFIYLIIYRPFKDSYIEVSQIISEVCLISVLVSVLALSLNYTHRSIEIIENIIVYSITACVCIQFIISILTFCSNIKVLYIKYSKGRVTSVMQFSNEKS